MRLALPLLLAALAAPGCISSTSRLDLPPRSSVVPGITTKDGVLEVFGIPAAIRREADGRQVLSYEQVRGRGYAAGVGWRGISLNVQDVDTATLAVEITLRTDGVVDEVHWLADDGAAAGP